MRRIELRGVVQGIGYRPWVYRLAQKLGVAGRVRNDAAGLIIDAFGAPGTLDLFIDRLTHEGPPASQLLSLTWRELAVDDAPAGFAIDDSEPGGERRVSVPPDLATCDACLSELFDPADRRYRYPFINCTACGPRYTIVRGVPYDRPLTSMAGFHMCPRCQAEYDAPADRRFHAQPNACPVCGPRLRALEPSGATLEVDPVAHAAAFLRAGAIVAVKGLGGYHLACDAGDGGAVALLRARKRHEAKPLAVMVADLAAADRLAVLSSVERELLASPQRPIVLAPRRESAPVSPTVSDTASLGLMLPYTPLHHLLTRAAGRALVMTSGNLSDEPIVFRDDEALAHLGGVADLFLVHDRPIEGRCDDSIARVIAGRPVPLRRARGWVPAPVRAPHRVDRPILAVGSDLKNAFALATGDLVYLGPHVGDLQHVNAVAALEQGVTRLERLLGVRPEVIAHDQHPDYVSTEWALARPDVQRVAVQHHHAHVASAMADAGLDEPVFGFAWDGTGWGPDGTAWGGELLLADYAGYERVATFRPIALPGGDRAVRQPWRTAFSALHDAFDGDPPLARLELFTRVPARELELVRQMLLVKVRTPHARGVGRWFDAFGALGLARPTAAYEGQVAIRWEQAADAGEREAYPFELDDRHQPCEVDLRLTLRHAARDLIDGRSAASVSARFHNTLVAASRGLLEVAERRFGRHPVVLTGGCFQNARLAEGVLAALAPRTTVHLHAHVPPGDGGLALGQALIADAKTRSQPCA